MFNYESDARNNLRFFSIGIIVFIFINFNMSKQLRNK